MKTIQGSIVVSGSSKSTLTRLKLQSLRLVVIKSLGHSISQNVRAKIEIVRTSLLSKAMQPTDKKRNVSKKLLKMKLRLL